MSGALHLGITQVFHVHSGDDICVALTQLYLPACAPTQPSCRLEGDHNSRRPVFFYQSVNIFFHNVLQVSLVVSFSTCCTIPWRCLHTSPVLVTMQDVVVKKVLAPLVAEHVMLWLVPAA
jgi:hypothetical protein